MAPPLAACNICLQVGGEALLASPCQCHGSMHLLCLQLEFEQRRCWNYLSCPRCRCPYETRVAVHLGKIALREAINEYGQHHVLVADAFAQTGNAYGKFGDIERQQQYLERALEIDTSRYDIYVDAGNAYGQLGQLGKQRELLEHAVGMMEEQYGRHHPDLAPVLILLGDLRADYKVDIHWSDNWEEHIQQELAKCATTRNLTVDTLRDALTLLDHHGTPLSFDGEGKPLLQRTAGNSAQGNGAGGRDRGPSNVSLIMAAMERVASKQTVPNRASSKRDSVPLVGQDMELASLDAQPGVDVFQDGEGEAVAAETAPVVCASRRVSVNDDAQLEEETDLREHFPLSLQVEGDAAGQCELYERSLIIREGIYGAEHCELVVPLTKLGNAFGRLGETERKYELLERALNIQLKVLGPKHREVAVIRFNLAHALCSLGNVDEAVKLMKNARTAFKSNFGEKHRHTQAADRALKYWDKMQKEAVAPAAG